MTQNNQESSITRIQRRMTTFFPEEIFTLSMLEEAVEAGDILYKPTEILPYLQTALFDEKIVEVEFDGLTRVYFSRVHDHLPELEESSDDEGNAILIEPQYTAGDYLKQLSHLITLPVEPGIGNVFIRNVKTIVLRIFTATYAVELGTFFQELTEIRELPVLRLDFPVIGRIVRGAREFRAKVPAEMELFALIVGKRKHKTLKTKIKDISASGMAFAIAKEQQELFRIDETRTLELLSDDMMMARVNATVRHISKIRGKKGTEYLVGIQFDLVTRAVASKIEAIVAQVQRAHLKELSDLSEQSGLDLIA
ncbi:MAG: PilZ domain-containing protein [Desulfobulbaceae bacterium]|nr:MAG: PilZ domain-containing protein [Desulfobulbaceae bacterium]